MIGYLKGTVIFREDPYILLSVSGVGYKVFASSSVLALVSDLSVELEIFTHTHVRDDALDLFGFVSREDLKLFEQLVSVSGIGPKTAMGIFTIGTREHITQAILQADVSFFQSVPRLGKKNAQKIIIELKSKIGSTHELDLKQENSQTAQEVVNALKAFGFSTKEASDALKKIDDKTESVTEKIRLALKELGK